MLSLCVFKTWHSSKCGFIVNDGISVHIFSGPIKDDLSWGLKTVHLYTPCVRELVATYIETVKLLPGSQLVYPTEHISVRSQDVTLLFQMLLCNENCQGHKK